MLYYSDNPIIDIVGVEHMRWKSGEFNVGKRKYSALAIRIAGNATITVDDKKYNVNENDILYMPQNLAYRARYTDNEIMVIHFVTLKDDIAPVVYSTENTYEIYKLFVRAYTVWKGKKPAYLLNIMSILYNILGTVFENRASMNLPQNFLKAVSYMNSRYKNPYISIGEVCKNNNISETTFRMLLKKYYGKTPIEYVTDLRIDNAKNLIVDGMSVEAAALESGFNDSKYFARVVKKRLGCTPRELKDFGK